MSRPLQDSSSEDGLEVRSSEVSVAGPGPWHAVGVICLTWRQSGKQRLRPGPWSRGVKGAFWTSWDGVTRGACGLQIAGGVCASPARPGVHLFKVSVLCPPCGAIIQHQQHLHLTCKHCHQRTGANAAAVWSGLEPMPWLPWGVTAGVHQQATVPSLLRSLLSHTHKPWICSLAIIPFKSVSQILENFTNVTHARKKHTPGDGMRRAQESVSKR